MRRIHWQECSTSYSLWFSSKVPYDKLNKHKDKVAGLMIRKKRTKNNPNAIAQAFLEEIERLEKDK
jgi:hypothetical protein